MIAINAAATDRNALILSEIQGQESLAEFNRHALAAEGDYQCTNGQVIRRSSLERQLIRAEIIIPILQAALEPTCALEPAPAEPLTERITELESHLKHLNWLILAMLGENDADRAWQHSEGTPEVGARYQDWLRSRAQLLSHARAYQLAHPR